MATIREMMLWCAVLRDQDSYPWTGLGGTVVVGLVVRTLRARGASALPRWCRDTSSDWGVDQRRGGCGGSLRHRRATTAMGCVGARWSPGHRGCTMRPHPNGRQVRKATSDGSGGPTRSRLGSGDLLAGWRTGRSLERRDRVEIREDDRPTGVEAEPLTRRGPRDCPTAPLPHSPTHATVR